MKEKLVKDGTDLIKIDPWLNPYRENLKQRYQRYINKLKQIQNDFHSLEEFAKGYLYYGVNFEDSNERKGWWYREWAPNALQLFLIGDFNGWNRYSHPLVKDQWGVWHIFLPYEEYKDKFVHGSKFKVRVIANNTDLDRIPAYATYVVQDPKTKIFDACLWNPSEPFRWTDSGFDSRHHRSYKIYEVHIGMAQEKEGIGTYNEFSQHILKRVKDAGYNTIQIMAIQEHPYYGSFGYHVSSFFAPSSRFGTPDDLKNLINTAHNMGLIVIMDLIHSHAIKNVLEGLNQFDGTDYQYFHAGSKGEHWLWDSKLFDYGKIEVLRFLLSNIRYWIEEFHFDGFRFDGVTSMMYVHHGLNSAFDHYDRYFYNTDDDAITYLQLANTLAHSLKPACVTIAEDVSGMPGLCRSIEEGGIGFDYRLSMGIPDFWIKTLKHKADEDWDMYELWSVMNNRRYMEKHVAYAESHDQALVGDKTIAFWLMDKEMYWHMSIEDENLIIDRGISLHKLIRFVTFCLGGDAYLNFIGNEFGHPEWVDFPREGNNWSYKYAKRQWHLVDDHNLKYKYLACFDKAMLELDNKYKLLEQSYAKQINIDNTNKVLIFEKKDLIFIFNFHPTRSIPDYILGVPNSGGYKVVFNSDRPEFGGFNRIDESVLYYCDQAGYHGLNYSIRIYTPARSVIVLENFKTKSAL